jgi:curved DNA-binding protein CbpA
VDQQWRGALRDAYAVLQVDPVAERDIVSAAYRVLARRYHPDSSTPDPVRMAEVNRAYDAVKTPEARTRYDQRGRPPVAGMAQPVTPPWSTPMPPLFTGSADGLATSAVPRPTRCTPLIDFGRYRGLTVEQVGAVDPDYLEWLSRHSSGVRYRDAIAAELQHAVGRQGYAIR